MTFQIDKILQEQYEEDLKNLMHEDDRRKAELAQRKKEHYQREVDKANRVKQERKMKEEMDKSRELEIEQLNDKQAMMMEQDRQRIMKDREQKHLMAL